MLKPWNGPNFGSRVPGFSSHSVVFTFYTKMVTSLCYYHPYTKPQDYRRYLGILLPQILFRVGLTHLENAFNISFTYIKRKGKYKIHFKMYVYSIIFVHLRQQNILIKPVEILLSLSPLCLTDNNIVTSPSM